MESKKVPFELGYRMPAEWSRHEATWLSWPRNPDSFPPELLSEVEKTYLDIIKALARWERVNILIDNDMEQIKIKGLLPEIEKENIIFHKISALDVWFRDYGPIFIAKDREIAFTHWKFNAWGGKYEDLKQDSSIPDRMPLSQYMHFDVPIVLEGGSIDMNGLGTCITTEQCMLNKNRNVQLNKKDIEGYIRDYLGATNFIWLKDGIAGDDTDGHVDDLARFVNENTVVCALEEDGKDENYAALKANYNILKISRDQNGNPLTVIPLPMPKPVLINGQRLPASYTNFYIANNSVLVPIFGDPNDKRALDILKAVFPDRDVIGINCRELVYGFGAIHCITQQQPAPKR